MLEPALTYHSQKPPDQDPVVFGLPFSYQFLFSAEKQSMCHILFPLTKLANTACFN